MSQKKLLIPLIALCLPLAMFAIDLMALTVGLKTIIDEFHIGMHMVQWLLTAYAIGNAAMYVTAGRLADKFGRKAMMKFGVCAFTLFSLTAAVSPDIYTLIASRALQGIAGAFILTSSMGLITHLYDGDERTWMLGKWVMVAAIASAIGPVVGGVLIEWFGWRGIFYINLPLGIIAWFMVSKYVLRDALDNTEESLDIFGLIFLAVCLVALVLGLSEGNTLGWDSVTIIGSFVVAFVSLVLFVVTELKVKEPMIEFKLFSHRNFIGGTIVGFLFYFFMFVWLLVFGVYMQQGYGLSPLWAGLSFLPMSVAFAFGSNYISRILKKYSARNVVVFSSALTFVSFLGLYFITAQTPYWYLLIFFLIMGLGLTGLTTPTLMIATQGLPPHRAGIASGVILTLRWLGSALGLAIFTAVYQAVAHSYILPFINQHHLEPNKTMTLDHVLSGSVSIDKLNQLFSGVDLSQVTQLVKSALAHGVSVSMLCLAVMAVVCFFWSLIVIKKG